MKDIYYLFLLVITALGSSLVTSYLPLIKMRLKQYLTRFKRKQVTDVTTYVELSNRMNELETQYSKRQANFKQRIREEVRLYLEELKTK